MNFLGVDFGFKKIGLAVSIKGIVETIPSLKNDNNFFENLKRIIDEYQIDSLFVGVSEGPVALASKKFAVTLTHMLKLPVETVEEAVSTIEAQGIYIQNKKKKKNYKNSIDSVAAAVILRRVIN